MTIKCDNRGIRLQGSTVEIIQDFINIINAVRISLEEDIDPEDVKDIMALCARMAYAKGDNKIIEEAEAFNGITALLVKNIKE